MHSHKAPNNIGRYLYALVSNQRDGPCGFCGINGRPVYSIAIDQVAAIVSDLSRGRMPVASRYLTAHEHVLEKLMRRGPVLPVVPGTVADNSLAVRRALLCNEDPLLQRLEDMAGKVEMRVHVTAHGTSVPQPLPDRSQERHNARDRVPGTHEKPCDHESAGSRRLAEQRQTCRREVESTLAGCSLVTRHIASRTDREILALACLVERTDHDKFETVVHSLACLLDPNVAVQCTGPVPPQNFVMVKLDFRQAPAQLTWAQPLASDQ